MRRPVVLSRLVEVWQPNTTVKAVVRRIEASYTTRLTLGQFQRHVAVPRLTHHDRLAGVDAVHFGIDRAKARQQVCELSDHLGVERLSSSADASRLALTAV